MTIKHYMLFGCAITNTLAAVWFAVLTITQALSGNIGWALIDAGLCPLLASLAWASFTGAIENE